MDENIKCKTRLQEARKSLGFTQKEVADQLHLTRQTMSKYENNSGDEFKNIPLENLIDLARLYHVTVDYLLYLSDEPVPQAKDFSMATGLNERAIATLTELKKNEAAGGLFLINELLSRGNFYKALVNLNQALHIQKNINKSWSKQGINGVSMENVELIFLMEEKFGSTQKVLSDGAFARDAYINNAAEIMKQLFRAIIIGNNTEDGGESNNG